MNFANVLSDFASDFGEELHTKNSWGKNEVSELFNRHFTQLLMNMVRQALEDDKSRKDAQTDPPV